MEIDLIYVTAHIIRYLMIQLCQKITSLLWTRDHICKHCKLLVEKQGILLHTFWAGKSCSARYLTHRCLSVFGVSLPSHTVRPKCKSTFCRYGLKMVAILQLTGGNKYDIDVQLCPISSACL